MNGRALIKTPQQVAENNILNFTNDADKEEIIEMRGLADRMSFENIKQSQHYNMNVMSQIASALLIQEQIGPEEKKLLEKIFPVGVIEYSSVVTKNDLTMQELEQLSLFPIFERALSSMLKTLIEYELEIDPLTMKPMKTKTGLYYMEIVNECLQNRNKTPEEIELVKQNYIIPILLHIEKVLRYFHYEIETQRLNKILFNPKSTKKILKEDVRKMQSQNVDKSLKEHYEEYVPDGLKNILSNFAMIASRYREEKRLSLEHSFNPTFTSIKEMPMTKEKLIGLLNQVPSSFKGPYSRVKENLVSKFSELSEKMNPRRFFEDTLTNENVERWKNTMGESFQKITPKIVGPAKIASRAGSTMGKLSLRGLGSTTQYGGEFSVRNPHVGAPMSTTAGVYSTVGGGPIQGSVSMGTHAVSSVGMTVQAPRIIDNIKEKVSGGFGILNYFGGGSADFGESAGFGGGGGNQENSWWNWGGTQPEPEKPRTWWGGTQPEPEPEQPKPRETNQNESAWGNGWNTFFNPVNEKENEDSFDMNEEPKPEPKPEPRENKQKPNLRSEWP